jgi:glucans biosynthesis protein
MLANRVIFSSHVPKMWRTFGPLILIGSLLAGSVCAASESAEVNLDYVAQLALERAQKPFHSPHRDLPFVLRPENLDYDKYRQIEFRPDRALWAADDLPFRIEFFHPGYIYHEPIHVNEFTSTYTQPIRFDKDFFDYHELNIARHIPSESGYAGFRVLNQLNDPGRWDELGSFLGASYFRLLGKNLRYGQSARGLALDCGEADRPEEFPIFTDWWLGKPGEGDSGVHLYAILDSVSCAGAYEFFIRPGETTTASIKAVLIFAKRTTSPPRTRTVSRPRPSGWRR